MGPLSQTKPTCELLRHLFSWPLPSPTRILRRTPSARLPWDSLWSTPTPPVILTTSVLSLELATLATEGSTTESARRMLTPSDRWLTDFPWPTLMPPATPTMSACSLESATLATATPTMASARLRLRRTRSARWPTVALEALSREWITATELFLDMELLETVASA